jgi:hypothetical protein
VVPFWITNKKHVALKCSVQQPRVALETKKPFVVSEWQLEELVAHFEKHDPMVKSWTLLCPA